MGNIQAGDKKLPSPVDGRVFRERIFQADRSANRDARRTRIFLHTSFILTICLQRFGFELNGSEVYLCSGGFLVLLAWMVWCGMGLLCPTTVILFSIAVTSFLVRLLFAVAIPEGQVGISLASLPAVLVANSVLLVAPRRRFDTSQVFPIFLFYARLCAVCGIVQYALQFVGIPIFSFMVTFPALKPILLESFYAYNSPLSYGSPIQRSNGFFLLEPSIFSQLMVAAAIVDAMLRRRFLWLPVYALAYMMSYSGTGLLGLLVALALFPAVSPKHIFVAIAFAVAGASAVTVIWFIYPAPVESILERSSEFPSSGSSAYARYLAQGQAWEYFSSSYRMLIGHGPGAFERSSPYVPGSTNPAIKLFADYGLIGLFLFILLIARSLWNVAYPILSLFFLALYQLGGGYLLFPPFLDLAALLCIWSKPSPAKGARVN